MAEKTWTVKARHEWEFLAAGRPSGVEVVAVCKQCGAMRTANTRETRTIRLEGECWRG